MNTESNAIGRVTSRTNRTSRTPRMFRCDLDANSLPGRGLFYSALIHWFFALAFIFLPWSCWLPRNVRLVTAASMGPAHEVLLLPALQPVGSGGSVASSIRQSKHELDAPSTSQAKARQGVVYKGAQLIVSDPEHPDNFVQTIRQPALLAPPRLPAPLPLPPMVSLASAKPELAPPEQQPTPDMPRNKSLKVVASAPSTPRVEAPKLSLPAAADALVHAVVADAVPAPMPKLAQPPPANSEKKQRDMLVVDVFSVPQGTPPAIPPGELYGTFTISPVGATAMGMAGGGAEAKGAPGAASAPGAVVVTSAAAVVTNPNASASAARDAAAAGSGAGHGTSGSGTTAGVHTSGNGNAPATGFGSSPFPAITIQGGRVSGGRGTSSAPAVARKPQTSYAITIVANGASGGGFKDYGVFSNETSYTVYLDMGDAGVRGPNWTLQYAVDSNSAPKPSAMASEAQASQAHGHVVPPYATLKSLPRFSPEAAKRGHGGMIVVCGVINREGKFEDLRIMQSAEPDLNQLMLDALAKWTFQPAQVDGVPVSVKVLLGVPVDSVPESDAVVQVGFRRETIHETARF